MESSFGGWQQPVPVVGLPSAVSVEQKLVELFLA